MDDAPPMNRTPTRVLLLEDSPWDARVAREALAQSADVCDVVHVERLADALDAIAEQPFDAIVLDLNVPDSRRLDTFRAITARAGGASPLIVLTASGGEDLARQALAEGAQDWVPKDQAELFLARSVRYAIARHASLRELSLKQRKLQLVMDSIPEALVVVDRDGIIANANRAFGAFAARDPQDLRGKDARDLMGRIGGPEAAALIDRVFEEGVLHTETPIAGPDGEIVLAWSGSLLRDESGRVEGAVGVARDVTAERRAEEIRAHFAALVESSTDAICQVGLDGTILAMNPAGDRLFGYGRGELLGMHISAFARSADELAFQAESVATLLQDGSLPPIEMDLFTKDGSPLPVSIAPFVVRSGETITSFGASFRDLRDQRRNEAQARTAQEAATEVALLKTVQETRQAFVNIVAHEIANPLTPLVLQVDLLEMKELGPLTEGQRRAVTVIRRNVDRISNLLQDVLDISRYQSGKLRLAKHALDLAELSAEAVDTYSAVAAKAGVDLTVRVTGPLPVLADPRRMTQVLMNLISNAVKYTPPGGRVIVETRAVNGEAVLEVRDTGTGLTPEQRARLFEPFSQVHDAKAQKPGTGLGLVVCKNILEAHEGRIWCASDGPGRGSTFGIGMHLAR